MNKLLNHLSALHQLLDDKDKLDDPLDHDPLDDEPECSERKGAHCPCYYFDMPCCDCGRMPQISDSSVTPHVKRD